MAENNYSEENIKVLEGLEAVRKRPAMYIGDVGERGLHHLINEVVDNSIDEALAGFATKVDVVFHEDGSCSVTDDGRGIPVGPHPVKKISTLEVVMCTLHAGGKFDKDTYKVSGGLHGVGVSCVNALSTKTIATIKIKGKIYRQEYEEGKPVTEVKEIGTTTETGTTIRFYPDDKIFKTTTFKFERTSDRLRELAFLNPSIAINFKDERDETEEVFKYDGGLQDFVNYMDEDEIHIVEPIVISGEGTANDNSITTVDVCFAYNAGYSENVLSYVNNINTIEGGTHVSGFRTSLTRTLNTYASNDPKLSKEKLKLTGDDFREGLTAVISVKVAEPLFEGQTKTKLGNSDTESIVRAVISEKLAVYLDANPSAAKRIIEKAFTAAEAREAAKKSRELVRRKNALEASTLPGKLADCTLKTPEDTEIYIVEGDSAGGSAKQGRDRRFQAILPLRGKVLNVHKAKFTKVLDNEEIRSIITALGVGFAGMQDEQDNDTEEGRDENKVENLRYGKIILMADADVDGSHIRTLLLTLFFKYFRNLIVNGHLYIAQPPLYKLKKGKTELYAYNDDERQEIVDRLLKESKGKSSPVTTTNQDGEQTKVGGITISRFKGLGEMNPIQLWETTMNPETRTLLQVTIEDAAKAAKIFQTLMGDKVEPRRAFIERNAKYVKNLDI